MARNDQARWATLGSEDAPDRWCTKRRRTPFRGQGLWAFWVPSSLRVTLWSKVHATTRSFVITGSA